MKSRKTTTACMPRLRSSNVIFSASPGLVGVRSAGAALALPASAGGGAEWVGGEAVCGSADAADSVDAAATAGATASGVVVAAAVGGVCDDFCEAVCSVAADWPQPDTAMAVKMIKAVLCRRCIPIDGALGPRYVSLKVRSCHSVAPSGPHFDLEPLTQRCVAAFLALGCIRLPLCGSMRSEALTGRSSATCILRGPSPAGKRRSYAVSSICRFGAMLPSSSAM